MNLNNFKSYQDPGISVKIIKDNVVNLDNVDNVFMSEIK